MLSKATIEEATRLKKVMDATYIVFRKEPTVEHANAWTAATVAFNDYCASSIKSLIEEDANRHEEILANIDSYKVCSQCGAEVLYQIDDKNYVTNINFVDYFPGWCYDCLLKHCLATDCESCTVSATPDNCPFSEVKKIKTN